MEVRRLCISAAQNGDQTFVGLEFSGVDVIRIGKSSSLITLSCSVNCITEHSNLLYLLCWSNGNWTVKVFYIDGKPIRSWKHEDSSDGYNKLVIYNDAILVPSRSQSKLKHYTLTGASAGKNITIKLSDTHTSLCVTTPDHVVVSQELPSLVVCVECITGTQLWKISSLNAPGGVVSDKCGHILVYTGGRAETGQ